MKTDKYILNSDGNPVPEPNLYAWAAWFEKADRHVANDTVNGYHISTVFLGLDHNFEVDGAPVLWETMVFKDHEDLEQERYSSREDALEGHKKFVEMYKNK